MGLQRHLSLVAPVILDPASGAEINTIEAEGVLVSKTVGLTNAHSIWYHDRFVSTYFSDLKGYYFSGDGCRRDADRYYWITGRGRCDQCFGPSHGHS